MKNEYIKPQIELNSFSSTTDIMYISDPENGTLPEVSEEFDDSGSGFGW